MSDQLSAHFTREEFACHDGCGFDTIDPALVAALEWLRESIGKPIQILSGCRCPKHNQAVGGEPNSQHMLGKAADIRVIGMTARELYAAANQPHIAFRGFGVDDYRNFLHVDVRMAPAHWCYGANGKQVPWY